MSGAQTSTFAPPNVLLNTLSGAQTAEVQQNQLMNQGKQLDLSNANQAQVQAAAAGLLSGFTDEASRAEAYPKYVGMLQKDGYAMNAPAQYPGEAYLRAIVNQGIPAKDLYSSGALLTPAQQQFLNTGTATSTPTTGATAQPTTGGPSFAGGIAGFESGGVSNPPENPNWPVAKGGPAGPHQFIASTWNQFAQANPDLFKGMTPDQILAARTDTTPVGPNGEDRSTLATNWYAGENAKVLQASNIAPTPTNLGIAHALGAGGATKVLSAPDNTPLSQVIPETIPQNPQYGRMTVGDLKQRYSRLGPVGGSASTAPAAGGGTPGRTQVASTVPVALPAATTEPQPAAAAPSPSGAPDTPWDLPGAPAPDLPPPSTPTTAPAPAATPAQPQQAPGPTAQPAPGGAPAAAPASTSRLPEVSTIPTGVNSPQYQQWKALQAKAMQADAVAGTNPTFKAIAVRLAAAADQAEKVDSIVSAQQGGREGKLNTITGEFTPYTPLPSPRGMSGTSAVFNPATKQYEPPTPANANLGPPVQGTWTVTGNGTQQFLPAATTPAEGGYTNMETAYKRDSEAIGGISQEGRTAQADQVRVQEMRNILKTTNTGSGAETQAAIQAFLQSWAPSALTNWTTNYANLDGPAAIQMFQKLGFMGATSQEQQTTPRGGYLATKLFQQFNPGAHLLTATNNGLLAQRLISNQASIDYTQGAQDQFAQQEQNFTSSKPSYSSLAQFDRQWQAQRQPQVYAAAIGALGQQDYNQWSKNLSDDEIQRTLDVVHRADPSAVVNGKGGRLDLSQQGVVGAQQPQAQTSTQQPAAAAPTRIIHFDANGKRM